MCRYSCKTGGGSSLLQAIHSLWPWVGVLTAELVLKDQLKLIADNVQPFIWNQPGCCIGVMHMNVSKDNQQQLLEQLKTVGNNVRHPVVEPALPAKYPST